MSTLELTLKWHPRQKLLRDSLATEIAYGGAVGGGKSYALRACSINWAIQIPGLNIYLFRKHYDELIRNHVDGVNGYRELLAPLVIAKACEVYQHEIRFHNGSKIHFCHCQQRADLDKYLGPEIHVLLIDQAEQFPESWIRFLRTRVRISADLKARIPKHLQDVLPRIIYSFNPGGASHGFFRKHFVKAQETESVWQTPDSEGGFRRQFIKALLRDNPSLNEAEYSAALEGLNDPELIRALLHGDMDTLVGNFYPEFSEDLHVIPNIIPNDWWFKFRSFDWGNADPFAVYWWCVSDGKPCYDAEGNEHIYPYGSLIAYREWYGADKQNPSKGLRMRNEEIAEGIVARTNEATSNVTVTDSFPFADRGGVTIAHTFMKHGCPLTLGDTSRVTGWSQLRSRLKGKDGLPLIYFTKSCIYARDFLPLLERHPSDIKREDAQEHGDPTHACDAMRLAAMCYPIVTKQKETPSRVVEVRPNISMTPAMVLKKLKSQNATRDSRF